MTPDQENMKYTPLLIFIHNHNGYIKKNDDPTYTQYYFSWPPPEVFYVTTQDRRMTLNENSMSGIESSDEA
jgi:hypothetical protein